MKIHLVISLFNEVPLWISEVPKNIEIFIYNKNPKAKIEFPPNNRLKVIPLTNIGRESDTYLTHIINHYHNLPDMIIFSQGDPISHSPDFVYLLNNYEQFRDVQCLTDRYKPGLAFPPDLEYNKTNVKNKFVNQCSCAPTLSSLNILETISFKDFHAHNLYNRGMEFLKLKQGESLIENFLKQCDIYPKFNKGKFPMVYYWCIGACFAVKKHRILNHSRESYALLKDLNARNPISGYLTERSWMIIFGPAFDEKELIEDLNIFVD